MLLGAGVREAVNTPGKDFVKGPLSGYAYDHMSQITFL